MEERLHHWNYGTHRALWNSSGDSNATLPVFNLGEYVVQQIKDHTLKIAKALNTKGLINIQFAVQEDKVFIIEANPRASNSSFYRANPIKNLM